MKKRIVGSLVGCLPQLSHQNSQLGPPLLLSTEEAALLDEQGIAEFIQIARPSPCTQEDKAAFKELYDEWMLTNRLRYEQERLEKINQVADKIVQGKLDSLKKLDSEGRVPPALPPTKRKHAELEEEQLTWNETKQIQNAESIESVTIPNREEIVAREIAKINLTLSSTSSGNTLTRIFTQCPMKDLNPNWIAHPASTSSKFSVGNEHQILLNAVFSFVHSKGYFVTRATKFGCDFLVYEGDPSIYHSKYMIYCQSKPNETLAGLQLINIARLANTVKKQLVFAAWKQDSNSSQIDTSDRLSFSALKWKGNYNPKKLMFKEAKTGL